MVGVPAMGTDQFLRAPPSSFPVGHWITDSLMALPLFAAGCWAGDLLAARMGLGAARLPEILKRSLITSLACALFLAPAWFAINQVDNPVTAEPIVFPHASDSGDVYSAPPAVIAALACVCLAPAACWLGRALTRATVAALLLTAATPALAWLLYRTATHAYASQVYYSAHAADSTAAPFAAVYQIAHALQDGLVGQAAGLPAAVLALLIPARLAPARLVPARLSTAGLGTARHQTPAGRESADRPTNPTAEEAME